MKNKMADLIPDENDGVWCHPNFAIAIKRDLLAIYLGVDVSDLPIGAENGFSCEIQEPIDDGWGMPDDDNSEEE